MAQSADLAVLTSDIYHQLRSSSILRANVRYYIGLRNVQLRWIAAGKDRFASWNSLVWHRLVYSYLSHCYSTAWDRL